MIWSMASVFGVPLWIDDRTLYSSYGCFAKVLVEVNFKIEVLGRILVKQRGYCSFSYVVENVPYFFTHALWNRGTTLRNL